MGLQRVRIVEAEQAVFARRDITAQLADKFPVGLDRITGPDIPDLLWHKIAACELPVAEYELAHISHIPEAVPAGLIEPRAFKLPDRIHRALEDRHRKMFISESGEHVIFAAEKILKHVQSAR